uniref:Large ribosomal subunit protein uL23m n=1 Tax=Arcella intermedia TaxID=1963864 RepID=A0A6B2LV15_9EUKA
MNKYEIKQYLNKIYGLDVIKVNTVVYGGKWKRDEKRVRYRESAYKNAHVTIDNTKYLDDLVREKELLAASNPTEK